MGKSRAPDIDEDGLARHRAAANKDLSALKNRFLHYEEQRAAEGLSTPFIAFEAIAGLLGAHLEGFSDEQVRTCWPNAWGTSAVSLPASVVMVLAKGWIKYKQPESSQTLGEVFKLEGGGQGKNRATARQAAVDRSRKYANQVVLYYTQQTGVSLEIAIEQVALEFGVGVETVQKSYKKHGKSLIAKAQEAGILK